MSKSNNLFNSCINYFKEKNPNPQTELHYSNPFELLVAVILSAQCTDKRVNLITPALFKRYTNAKSLAESDVEEIFEYIKSCSYPNSKAKHLHEMGKILHSKFNSIIPSDVNLMQELPGVGRKTANVIAAIIYNKPTIAVDTHVFRVANRIGLAVANKPHVVEEILIKNTPKDYIPFMHHWLILHGRYVCKARNPECKTCGLQSVCKNRNIVD